MNNSLFCPHNILLSRRCPHCVVERRVSYSNRLQNLINLTEYENRLENYSNNIMLYQNSLLNYMEIQIRNKMISDINYLLTFINDNSYNRDTVNIRRFYRNLLNELNLFNPDTFHINQDNLRRAQNLILENRSILNRVNSILDNNSLNSNNSIISQRIGNVGRPSIRIDTNNFRNNIPTRSLSLSIKDLNKNSKLEIYQREEGEDEQNCAICLTALENNTIIRKLSCNHKFHYKCIDKWLEDKHKCPICRSNLINYTMV